MTNQYINKVNGMPIQDTELRKIVNDKTEILPVKNEYVIFEDAVPRLMEDTATYGTGDDGGSTDIVYIFDNLQNTDMIVRAARFNLIISFNDGTEDITENIIVDVDKQTRFLKYVNDYSVVLDYDADMNLIAVSVTKGIETDTGFKEIPCTVTKATFICILYSNLLSSNVIKDIKYEQIVQVPNTLEGLVDRRYEVLDNTEYYYLYDNSFVWDMNRINERLDENSGVTQNTSVTTVARRVIAVNQKDSEGIGFGQLVPINNKRKVCIFAKADADVIVKVYNPNTKELMLTMNFDTNNSFEFTEGYLQLYQIKDINNIFIAFTIKDTPSGYELKNKVQNLIVTDKFTFLKKEEVLTKTNTKEYVPTGDYNPATKKYVDDSLPHYNETLKFEISGDNFRSYINNNYFNINALNLDETKLYVGKEKYDINIPDDFIYRFVYDKENDALINNDSNLYIYNHKSYDGTNFTEDENSAVLALGIAPMFAGVEGNGYFRLYEVEKLELDNNCLSDNVSILNSLTVGDRTGIIGKYSVAEGYQNTASGSSSHAEGEFTTASTYASHAEGSGTTSSGNSSHAEGSNTTASGEYSHTEGYYTIASSNYQHAQGKYNIEDTEKKYAHIVGNGTSSTARSNAHTLDWNGNAWYQGKLSQDGTPTEDKDLTTKKYVDDNLPHYNETLKFEISGEDYNSFMNNKYFNMSALNIDETKSYIGKINSDIEYTFKFVYNKEADALMDEVNQMYIYNHKSYNGTNFIEDENSAVITNMIATFGTGVGGGTGEVTFDGCFRLYEVDKVELDTNCLPKDVNIPNSLTVGVRKGNIGEYSVAEGNEVIASGEGSHAEGEGTEATGNISHAEGAYTIASGNISHAEGGYTTASGDFSHAEGRDTTASGEDSHAEGESSNSINYVISNFSPSTSNDVILTAWNENSFSLAKGTSSHVEGKNCLALGDYSHVEGSHSIAIGIASHVEGLASKASGGYSHAEGNGTTADGMCSHAEGDCTIASSENQHVQGKFNIEDTENKYAHIVGNGEYNYNTDEEVRSNAHTLDWNGNAWYQGKLSQDGTPTEDKDLVTKKYVDGKVENMPYTIEKNIVLQIPQSSITSTSYRAEFPIFEYDSNKRYIINYNNEEHELYQYPANLSSPNGSTIKGPTLLCELNSGKEIRIRLGSTSSGADDTKLYIEVGEIATTDLVLIEYSVKTLDNKYIPKHFESLLSISLGRKKGTTIGLYSSVLGYDSEATNYHAHAEGESTTASGESSHAEGNSTVASGENSHAEGSVAKAIGDMSHAEGFYTEASGSCSHAEGSNTKAIGMYSHVEGSETKTKGRNSHAEGYSTIASGEYQHVEGKNNIEDKTNTYVHIVGNGTSDTARSNAHTLDWNGNAWYQGKLSQDGTPTEDKDLVTKKYVDEKFLPNSAIHTMTLKLNTNEVNFIQSMVTNNYNNALEHITKGDLSSIIDNSIETIIFEGLENYPYKVVGAYRGFNLCECVLLELAISNSTDDYYAFHRLTIEYSDDLQKCFLSSYYGDLTKISLTLDNTTEYTPTEDYNPATKKYVDDKISSSTAGTIDETDLDTILTDIYGFTDTTE